MTEATVWLLACLIAYVYLGYPALLLVLSRLRPAPPIRKADNTPSVSLVIPAYNEEKVIAQKIENALALDYPRNRLEIIVASDGSTDATNDIVARCLSEHVRLIAYPERTGKTAMLNRVVPCAHGEIIVFTDANSIYHAPALRKLVRNFRDPTVGCVCGRVSFSNPHESSISGGENAYYRYETFLKERESEIHSVLSAYGGIYAIRRRLFQAVDPACSDDFAVPLSIVLQGYRSVQDSEAVAFERTSTTTEDELSQKRRIIARDLKAYLHMRGLFAPFRGWISIQLFSHKFLRWIVPLLLIGVFAANCLLSQQVHYLCLLLAQSAFYLLAFLGWLAYRSGNHNRLLHLPFYFCVVNLAALRAIWWVLARHQTQVWQPAPTTR